MPRPFSPRPTSPPTALLQHWVADLIHVQSTDRVLELGDSPSLALHAVAFHLTNGHVVGLDPRGARLDLTRHYTAPMRDNQVCAVQGMGEALPFAPATFDKALAVAVLEGVPEPLALLCEVRRVLRPGGLVAVCWLPGVTPARLGRPAAGAGHTGEPVEVIELLLAAGFTGPWMRTNYSAWGEGRCAQATKPAD